MAPSFDGIPFETDVPSSGKLPDVDPAHYSEVATIPYGGRAIVDLHPQGTLGRTIWVTPDAWPALQALVGSIKMLAYNDKPRQAVLSSLSARQNSTRDGRIEAWAEFGMIRPAF